MKNPFKYGSRVSGGAFFDREKIMRDMMGVLDGGNNVVLYGPRRYGKSSLVGENRRFVIERFRSVGIKMPEELAARVVSLAGNVPYYVQAVSSWAYNTVVGGRARTIRAADVEEAFLSLYATETILMESVFASRPESQRLLMRALDREPTARFDEEYRDRHSLPSTSTVNTALRRLVKESIVELRDGAYALSDPLLAYHLSSRG